MKLNNTLIVLDLEATRDEETHANNCIIEIGAVALNEKLEIVSGFSTLVKPTEPVTPFITQITSITPEMVENAPDFKSAAMAFEAWIAGVQPNLKKVRLSAWGNYFDMPLLRKCYRDSGLVFPFSGTCFDVKTIAFMWASLSGHRTDKLGVGHVASLMGIEPEGSYHRALTDAVVEAKVLQRVFKDLGSGFFLTGGAKGINGVRYVKIS